MSQEDVAAAIATRAIAVRAKDLAARILADGDTAKELGDAVDALFGADSATTHPLRREGRSICLNVQGNSIDLSMQLRKWAENMEMLANVIDRS